MILHKTVFNLRTTIRWDQMNEHTAAILDKAILIVGSGLGFRDKL